MSLLNLRNKYEREECCGVATENQIECTIIDNREVAGERRTALMEYILHSLPLLTEEQLDEINHLLDEQLL